jgi:hypothetical protein
MDKITKSGKLRVLVVVLLITAFQHVALHAGVQKYNYGEVESILEEVEKKSKILTLSRNKIDALRDYCFSKTAKDYRRGLDRDPEFLARALWVLIKAEYTSLITLKSNANEAKSLRAQSIAWKLSRSIDRLIKHLVKHSLSIQPTWIRRILLIRSYQVEARKVVMLPIDNVVINHVVSQELLKVFSPVSIHDVNRQIQSGFRNTFKTAEDALLAATAAKNQAISSIKDVYGSEPDKTQKINYRSLSETENSMIYAPKRLKLIYKLLDIDQKRAPETSDYSESYSDTSLIGNYSFLKGELDIEGKELPKVEKITGYPTLPHLERIFENLNRLNNVTENEYSIEKIENLFKIKLKIDISVSNKDYSVEHSRNGKDKTKLQKKLTEAVSLKEETNIGFVKRTFLDNLLSVYPEKDEKLSAILEFPYQSEYSMEDIRIIYEAVNSWLDSQNRDEVIENHTMQSLTKEQRDMLKKFIGSIEAELKG